MRDLPELDEQSRDLFGLPPVLPRRANGYVEPGEPRALKVRRHTIVSVKFLLERFGNPVEGLLRMASYNVEDLAAFLGISKHEAWVEKRLLLAMAAPYLVSKMPQGVVVAPMTGLTIAGFNFGGSAPGEAGADGVAPQGAAPGEHGFVDQALIKELKEEVTIDGEAVEIPSTDLVGGLKNHGRSGVGEAANRHGGGVLTLGDLFASLNGEGTVFNGQPSEASAVAVERLEPEPDPQPETTGDANSANPP
jgi:hypothetical protein